jgi:carboxymethylenebutenolidase
MTESSTVKNLGAVFDAHVKAEFIDKDVAATMATMVSEPYLTHVPTLTGGTGRSEVESFYRDHFVGHWPDDVEVKPLSRTVGQNRVVDELIVSFTHDREMRVFLPGVPPTGRKVVLPHVVVMGFDEPVASPTNTSTGIKLRFWCRLDYSILHRFRSQAPNRPNVCSTTDSLRTR